MTNEPDDLVAAAAAILARAKAGDAAAAELVLDAVLGTTEDRDDVTTPDERSER